MQRIIHLAASCGLVILFAALLPFVANAHERREVADGQYELTVGFLDEPAFVGLKNGLDLRVERTTNEGATPTAEGAEGASQGVEGLTDTLQAEVIYGDQTMELELEPAFGEPGSYESVFFPMATGAYTFTSSARSRGRRSTRLSPPARRASPRSSQSSRSSSRRRRRASSAPPVSQPRWAVWE